MCLGLAYAPVVIFVEKYLLSEMHLLINLFILVFIDTIMGVIYAYKQKRISSAGFSKAIVKMLIYILLLIAVNQGHINVNPSPLSTIMEWLDGVVYSTIVIRELLSIIEKATILGYIKLPQKVKERLDIFMNND